MSAREIFHLRAPQCEPAPAHNTFPPSREAVLSTLDFFFGNPAVPPAVPPPDPP